MLVALVALSLCLGLAACRLVSAAHRGAAAPAGRLLPDGCLPGWTPSLVLSQFRKLYYSAKQMSLMKLWRSTSRRRCFGETFGETCLDGDDNVCFSCSLVAA